MAHKGVFRNSESMKTTEWEWTRLRVPVTGGVRWTRGLVHYVSIVSLSFKRGPSGGGVTIPYTDSW